MFVFVPARAVVDGRCAHYGYLFCFVSSVTALSPNIAIRWLLLPLCHPYPGYRRTVWFAALRSTSLHIPHPTPAFPPYRLCLPSTLTSTYIHVFSVFVFVPSSLAGNYSSAALGPLLRSPDHRRHIHALSMYSNQRRRRHHHFGCRSHLKHVPCS